MDPRLQTAKRPSLFASAAWHSIKSSHAPYRYALHGFLVGVALIAVNADALGFAQHQPQNVVSAATDSPVLQTQQSTDLSQSPVRKANYIVKSALPLAPAPQEAQAAQAIPVTEEKEVTLRLASVEIKPLAPTIREYIVVPNDTLSQIASKFDLTTMTLIWANNIPNPDSLKLGSTITIPPTSGVLHTIRKDDTLSSLATRYDVNTSDIIAYPFNEIPDPDTLRIGQKVMVPGGVKPVVRFERAVGATPPNGGTTPAATQLPGTQFQWPTSGPIFSWFSAAHRGLDISPAYGTPVYAAEAGVVVKLEYLDWGYGYYLIIDHENGYQTLYSHLSKAFAVPGQRVELREHIGNVGTTGQVTGPHLHFEMHHRGVAFDPLQALPR